jgi:hypothetical protein
VKTTLAAVALSTAALLLGSASPATAATETEIKPAQLERGEDVRIPHLEGKTVVDGDVRVKVRVPRLRLLGKSGDDYVVGASNKSGGGHFRVLRVTADGERAVLFRKTDIWELELSGDGTQIGRAFVRGPKSTRMRVWDAVTGEVQAERRFRGSLTLLDFDEERMVLGGWGPNRTFWWHTRTDQTKRIAGRPGHAADIGGDRVATYTRDPYRNGCTVVTSLSDPGTRLWRSCDERVATFSPDGQRMTTISLLADGLGPAELWLRRAGGRLLVHYSTPGWFGAQRWETDRALLLDTVGARKQAVVRCEGADCERASDLRRAPSY